MPHDISLITTLAAALGLGLIFGLIAHRLRLPALIGYLIAGVIIGPGTPGFSADINLANQLAEIGVMLLMFGVGLHFSLQDLWSVRKTALPGAVLQIFCATVLGTALAMWWGWSLGAGLLFGLALSVASTVVLLRALDDRNLLNSEEGKIAIGWLIVEDLVMVIVLVMVPALVETFSSPNLSSGHITDSLLASLGRIVAFVAFMLIVGRRLFPKILAMVERTGSRELFTLCVISAALGIAFLAAKIFGVSFALGAFFAGMVLRESELSHRAAEESLPLREAFSVLFFVSVGMLFDPKVLIDYPWHILATLFIIVVGKSFAAFALILLLRYPLKIALTVSASLAQIGEFSFILIGLGLSLNILPVEAQSYVLAGAILSIAINPLFFHLNPQWEKLIYAKPHLLKLFERPGAHDLEKVPEDTSPSGHVVVIGYGNVGQEVVNDLVARGQKVLIVEQNREEVERLREQGLLAIAGDAADLDILEQAYVMNAKCLLIATKDNFGVENMIAHAGLINKTLPIVVRSHNKDEDEVLRRLPNTHVLNGDRELADSLIKKVQSIAP